MFKRLLNKYYDFTGKESAQQFGQIDLSMLSEVIENIPLAVFVKDAEDEFKVKLWNRAAEEIFELPREAILEKNAHDLWPKNQADLYLAADKKAFHDGKTVEVLEEPSQTKTRGVIYLHTKKIPIKLKNGQRSRYLLCICEDITKKRETELQRQSLAEQLNDAQKVAKIGTWSLDLNNYHLLWSEEHYRIFELSENLNENTLFEACRTRTHPDDVRKIDALIDQAKRTGEGFRVDFRLVFENGRTKRVRAVASVIKDCQGKLVRLSGTCQDITLDVQREEEIQFILESLQIGIWKYDPRNQSLFWDRSMYDLYEINEKDFTGHYQAWESTLTEAAKAKAVAELNAALDGQKEFDTIFEIHTKSKGVRYIAGRGKVVRDDKGSPVMMYGMNMDVTFQKESELDRERLSKFLEVVLQNVPLMIFVKDYKKNLSFSLLNKFGEKLLGVNEGQILGKNDYDFFPKHQADFFTEKDRSVFATRTTMKVDREEIATPKGQRILTTYKVPTFDEQGNPHLLIGISDDITEEIKAKEDLEQERLKSIQHAKLASLGEMSAGIAHEINNPLAIIDGVIHLIPKLVDQPDKLATRLESVKKATQRISKIVGGLKKFSRSGEKVSYAPCSLHNIVMETLVLTEAKSKRHGVPITFESMTKARILCDEVGVEQVLVNLINNGIDAIGESSEKWVKITISEESTYVVLRVIDSGPGIPETTRGRIFEPFFTTKKIGQGTGLGLSISKGILDEHGATIRIVDDLPNTCFEIRFKKYVEQA